MSARTADSARIAATVTPKMGAANMPRLLLLLAMVVVGGCIKPPFYEEKCVDGRAFYRRNPGGIWYLSPGEGPYLHNECLPEKEPSP